MKNVLALKLPKITNPNVPTDQYGATPEAGIERLVSLGIGTATIAGAILLIVYFAYGALRFVMSGGDSKGQEAGRSAMANAAIGFVILVLVTTIAAIVGRIFGVSILEPEWTKIFV